MSASSYIRKHINSLEKGQIFTTREMLNYGSRAAVDNTLFRMVDKGLIDRLTSGVFVKPDHKGPNITAWQVACVKAKAFGKKIVRHEADIAADLDLEVEPNEKIVFRVSGRSTHFRFGLKVIHFKGTSQKTLMLGNSKAGEMLRALHYVLPVKQWLTATRHHVRTVAAAGLNRFDRIEIRRSCPWIPSWLSDICLGDERPWIGIYSLPDP